MTLAITVEITLIQVTNYDNDDDMDSSDGEPNTNNILSTNFCYDLLFIYFQKYFEAASNMESFIVSIFVYT